MGRKVYILIMTLALILAGAAAGFGIHQSTKKAVSFWGDGYVLTYQNGEGGTLIPQPLYFNAGTRYKKVYPDKISFKDTSGNRQEVSRSYFIHYADESISTFEQGVVLEFNELNSGLLNYYSVGKDSVMSRQGDTFLLDNQGTPLEFRDFIWKTSEDRFLVSSSGIEVMLPAGETKNLSGYVELEYIDNGIVRMTGKDEAFQVLSMGTALKLKDGTVVDVENRSILEGEEVRLSLDEITLEEGAGGNIDVVPSENRELRVPTFDITTIDGENGQQGEDGEEGAEGEAGEEGAEGEAGEEGGEGEAGQEGGEGQEGSAGSDGNDGSAGSSGSKGASGATGGTAGSGGSSGSASEKVVMPVYVLAEFEYDISTVKGAFIVDNADDISGVELTAGHIRIADTETGSEVFSEEYDGDIMSAYNPIEFASENLQPDKQYKLMFNISYRLTESGAEEDAKGEKTVLSRTFSTSSHGIQESYDHAGENSITVSLEKKAYAEASRAQVILKTEAGEEIAVETVDWSQGASDGRRNITFDNLRSNTAYTVIVQAMNQKTGAYEIVSTASYKTLKTAPKLLTPPVVANNPRGYFEMRPDFGTEQDGIVDTDHGIISYRYDIYSWTGSRPGELVQSVSGDGTETVILYADEVNIMRGQEYVARLVVEFDDNEKVVEYESPFSEYFFIDENTGVPYFVFKADEIQYDKIIGTLTVNFNNAVLDVSATKPLEVWVFNEAIGDNQYFTWNSDPRESGNTQTAAVPVTLTGLKANTTYRFNLYGYYEGDDVKRLMTTTIVKTNPSSAVTAEIRDASDIGSTAALNALLYFKPDDAGTGGGRYEANKIREVHLTLKQGGLKLGETVKTYQIAEPDSENGILDFESDFDEKCFQKEADTEPSEPIVITNTDFNINNNAITGGNYTLTVDYLTDYTAIDDYRYQSEKNREPNRIEVKNNSLDLNPTETPPPLPKQPLEVAGITKVSAKDLGIDMTPFEDLPNDTIIGFALRPMYDNSGNYAKSYTMYGFDKKEYDSHIGNLTENEIKSNPLEALKAKSKAEFTWTYDRTTSWGSSLPGMIVFMGDGKDEVIQNSSSRYNGYHYKFFPQMERGKRYVFAYDINLEFSKYPDYVYPYEYSEYVGVNQILRSGVDDPNCNAPRIRPVYYTYPWEMDNTKAVWKVKADDPDQALMADSFRLTYSGGTAMTNCNPAEVAESYKDISFTSLNYTNAAISDSLILESRYKAYYEGGDGDGITETLLTQEHMINLDSPSIISIKRDEKDEENNNSFVVDMTISGDKLENQVAAAAITFTAQGGPTKNVIVPLEFVEANKYTASVSRNELADFRGKPFNVAVDLLYAKPSYGFSDSASGYAALQTDGGIFLSTVNGKDFHMQSTIQGSILKIDTVATEDNGTRISFSQAYGDSFSGNINLSFQKAGAVGNLITGGHSYVLRYLESTRDRITLENQEIDYIIPVVTNASFTPAMFQTDFTFNLTGNVEELLAAGTDGEKEIIITAVSEGLGDTKEYSFKLSDLKGQMEGGKYRVVLKDLNKGTRYTVSMSALLAGGQNTPVKFKDHTGKDASFEFTTLDIIEINITRSRIINEYYHYKMLEVLYDVKSITGVKFRCDIYDVTEGDEGTMRTRIYSYEELQAMSTEGGLPSSDKRKRFYEKKYAELRGNYMRLDLAPPAGLERFKPDHIYQIKISAYPENTDYKAEGYEKFCVGEKWSDELIYPRLVAPNNQISILQNSETKTMTITPMMQDTSLISVSEGYIKLNEDTGIPEKGDDGRYVAIDEEGKELDNPDAVTGGYVVQVMEAVYADKDKRENPVDWKKVELRDHCTDEELAQRLESHCIHGMTVIELKGLERDWEYKIQMFTRLDQELKGMDEIKPNSEAFPDADPDSVMLTEYIQRTVGENGVLLDKSQVSFKQKDASTVAMTIYNAVGISAVKNMQVTFMPKDSFNIADSVDTGMISVTADMIKTTAIGSNSGTKTEITIPISFKNIGNYTVVVALYGDNTTDDPLLKISSTEGKFLEVDMLPARMKNTQARLPYRVMAAEVSGKKREEKDENNA